MSVVGQGNAKSRASAGHSMAMHRKGEGWSTRCAIAWRSAHVSMAPAACTRLRYARGHALGPCPRSRQALEVEQQLYRCSPRAHPPLCCSAAPCWSPRWPGRRHQRRQPLPTCRAGPWSRTAARQHLQVLPAWHRSDCGTACSYYRMRYLEVGEGAWDPEGLEAQGSGRKCTHAQGSCWVVGRGGPHRQESA